MIGGELALLRDLATGTGRRALRLGLADDVATTVARDADGIAHASGDLERFVVNFVDASPKRDSMRYVPPTAEDRALLERAWTSLRAGDVLEAARLAEPSGMQVIRFTDAAGGGAVHHALIELPFDQQQLRGLGMFLHRRDAATGALHVQVPHPWDDIATEAIGTGVYRQAEGATLAIAGASRYAVPGAVSDAAHARATLFHALTDQTAGRGVRQLQLHGFNEARHTSYGQAVVSTGSDPTRSASRLRDSLQAHGIDARLAGDGRPYVNLAGRRNVQGIDARAVGADWLHVEAGGSIRHDPIARRVTIEALADGARPAR